MAARSSMAGLITRLRAMIGDPGGLTPVWSDDELQNALDANRDDIRHMPLVASETIASGGVVTWMDYYAPGPGEAGTTILQSWTNIQGPRGRVDGRGDWETDVLLQDATFATLTAATSDYIVGHWTFAASTAPPVYLTGKCYDLAAAAADVCEQWASKVALVQDYQNAGLSDTWMHKTKNMQDMAQRFRGRARARTGTQVRGDVTP